MTVKRKLPRPPAPPAPPTRAVAAEVMSSAQSSWPREQRKLYGWLERTPASVDMLRLVAMGAPEELVLEVSIEEAKEIGRERLAERIYLQGSEFASEMERVVRFRVMWFSGSQPKITHYFSAGASSTEVAPYDGSLASLLKQNQVHLENTQQLFGTLFASTVQAQSKIVEGMQRIIQAQMEREIAMASQLAELRAAVPANADDEDDEDDEGDRITQMVMQLASQFLPPPQGPGENH